MKFLRASLIGVLFLGMASNSWAAPLSLRECLIKAHDNNPALKSIAWDSRIAEENSRLASAARYPRIDATAGYTMQLDPQAVKIGGVTAETQEPDFATAGLAATYTLYDFGRRDARIRQAHAYTNAASQSFLSTSGDYALQVIAAYFGILETQRLIQAADEEVAQITEHRRIAQVLFEEGVVTRNDVLQADVRLASARQKQLAVISKRDNDWLLLNFLTGSEPGFRGELDEATTLINSRQNTTKPLDILGNRHDIRAQRQILDAREFEVQENRNHYIPEIYTRLSMDYVQNDKVREQAIYSATVGIRVNLFDGYAAQAVYDRALKKRSQQQDAFRLAEQRAQLEIATARNDANVAQERISVTEAAIKQSEENLRINEERYQARVGIASEVLDAQTLVTQTKTDYYRALYDYQTATARLQNARGEL
ncbi:MAG: TolC family protein [Desulfuromonadaceae bacterium]|nr:TolC family protein [Desulfuromonadaceae bacterium]